jgi:histidinol-phosphate aminotransferase
MIQELSRRYSLIKPYRPGESVFELAQRLGMETSDILKLNANENLFVQEKYVTDLIKQASEEVDPRLYPQKEGDNLKEAISKIEQINPEEIIIASGGDHLIEILLSAFLRLGDVVQAITPTFSMYPRTCLTRGLKYIEENLDRNFTFDPEKITYNNKGDSKALIVCNPNNPTGNQFKKESIIRLINGYQGIVFLDEAYAEYGKYTIAKEAVKRKNLVILRTFSKAYGLAGMRLGYIITNEELARLINERYMMPYPVSSLTLKTGLKVLQNIEYFEEKIQMAKRSRDILFKKLNKIKGVKAFPSDTNFILFTTKHSMDQVYSDLLNLGIIIRKIGNVPGYRECLRVTVAPIPINRKFTSALEEVLK